MNKIKVFLTLLFSFTALFLNAGNVFATGEKFITVVNPVRISSYNKTPAETLRNQYSIIKNNNIPATWLLTYDSIQNKSVTAEIKRMDKGQEFGLFLEISPSFAKDAGVIYHDTGSWHYATSVFLSGYTQEERVKLVDKIFQKFKETFGYYPKSVGAWGTDSFSLDYINSKYGVVANLTCSDQLSTDGYQIWGQPWAMPYYPSRFFTLVPASTPENKLDLVNLQWAPRGPLNGYTSSLYSTQDYMVAPKPQKIEYFKKLVDLYTSYGQITVGLESDLDPNMYKYEFARQMDYVAEVRGRGVKVVTMSDYANWYRKTYPDYSPAMLISSTDYLGTGTKALWYTSNRYRLFYTEKDGKIILNDLRVYDPNLQGPYTISPNSSFSLSRNAPYVISTSENPEDAWILPEGTEIKTSENSFQIIGPNVKIPDNIKRSKLISINATKNIITITFPNQDIPRGGVVYKDYSSEAMHFFGQKKAILMLLIGKGWNYFKKVEYRVPQGEVYALKYLESLRPGSVLVYDHECLQCSYHTKLPSPAFTNRRGYVGKFSNHSTVYNKDIFEAKDRKNAKESLNATGVKYIYLVKFENYEEKLPFSPGDLGVTKIFSNANAEIWKVL